MTSKPITDGGGHVAPAVAPQALPGGISFELERELKILRRSLHSDPELGFEEVRTTFLLKGLLEKAGLRPRVLDCGTGLICDINPGLVPEYDGTWPVLVLRADIDALPIQDTKTVSYRSRVPGRAHACGHDLHTTVVLGAGLVLAEMARRGELLKPVRLLFQPGEETAKGSLAAIRSGAVKGAGRILAVHADPKVMVGRVGLKVGPITSTYDRLEVRLLGEGGHTARSHETTDMGTAASAMGFLLPQQLAGRVDPRTGLRLTWGRIKSGDVANVIPSIAELEGTVRCLDLRTWYGLPDVVSALAKGIAGQYGAEAEVEYVRGVPPVVNDADATGLLRDAMAARYGAGAVEDTEQSLGGEDFSWYLEHVPGAMARLGVRRPGDSMPRQLHQGDFDVDEGAIRVGVEMLTAAVLLDARRRS